VTASWRRLYTVATNVELPWILGESGNAGAADRVVPGMTTNRTSWIVWTRDGLRQLWDYLTAIVRLPVGRACWAVSVS
jgi:hypothetical protein